MLKPVRNATLCLLLTAPLSLLAADPVPPAPPPPPATPPPAAAPAAAAQSAGKPVDKLAFLPKVLATYGTKSVTDQDVRRQMEPQLAMMAAAGRDIPEDAIKAQVGMVIDRIIVRDLLLQRAAKDGIKPDTIEAARKLGEIEKQLGAEQFAAELKKSGLTRDQILEQIGTGMTIDKWVTEKVIPTIPADDAAAEKYYKENPEQFAAPEQVQASHILIKIEPGSDAAVKAKAQAKADDVLVRLKKGGEGNDFATLAKANSDCPSKKEGGDLGFFPRGQMIKAFEDTAFTLKPGEISGVVETQFGYHIIKGGEHKTAQTVALAEVKEQIKEQLRKERVSEAMEKVVSDLRQEAKVDVVFKAPPPPPMMGPPGMPPPPPPPQK